MTGTGGLDTTQNRMREQIGKPQETVAPAAHRLLVPVCIAAMPLVHVVSLYAMQTSAIVFSLLLAAILIKLSVHDRSNFLLPNALTYALIGLGVNAGAKFHQAPE